MAPTVRQYMTPNPFVVDAEELVGACAKLMDDHDIGAVGVVRDSRLVGVLTDRDIVVRAVARNRDPREIAVRELATTNLVTVAAESSLEEAERRMRGAAVRRLFVVDDEGRPVGILTADDLIAFRDPDSVAAHQIGEWGLARSDVGFTGQVD